jgi:hypothetical protein
MSPEGWPFLIGAGRRHEYRTLLAPDFLVAGSEYGLLDRYVRRTADGENRVVQIRAAPRALWIAYTTSTVTPADVPDPRDEHSRPLQVHAGFVCAGALLGEPDATDLAVAREAGMAVYRRYLDDEDRFGVEASAAYPLRSAVRPAGVAAARSGATAPVRRRPGRRVSRRAAWMWGLIGLGLVAVVTGFVVAVSGGDGGKIDGEPSCGPTPTPAAVAADDCE